MKREEGFWPRRIQSTEELEEVLTRPGERLVEFIPRVKSPLLVLGAGGKMGPTLCVMARRAAEAAGVSLDVVAVSRFSEPASREWLETRGIRTMACDLLDRASVDALPESENVIYLAGMKFGTRTAPALTWAVNTVAPIHVAERFSSSRIVALSTGNVYPFVNPAAGGVREDHPLTPLGEYSNAAVARDRLFQYYSSSRNTPVAILRLNYAVELRYGVLVDIALKVWNRQPLDVTMGHLNCIWQPDANEAIIRSLDLAQSPAAVFNVTGSRILSVRELAHWFGRRMGRTPEFTGTEAQTALLSNPAKMIAALGEPRQRLEQVLEWVAAWVMEGKELLGKPTHFEVRDGVY